MIEPLVSAQWLAAQSGDGLCVLDIRSAVDGGGAAAYEAAHVPGAVHTDYVKDGWRATKGMASGLLPDHAHLADLFARCGITPAVHVLVVGAGTSPGDFSAAARVYWTLKVAGHPKQSVLDGGMTAWQEAGLPVESGRRTPPAVPVYPVQFVGDLRADLGAVKHAVAVGDEILLDTRSTSYFEGREKSPQAKRAGRLPDAVHLDHARAFDPATRRLKPLPELERLFVLPAQPIVSYCNTGHQAATSWFILSEVLRRPRVRLYDGSMSEWTEDETRPVEVGPG
jgi:thiosulfate/3-mercaptopyruvate sulfurtransferase